MPEDDWYVVHINIVPIIQIIIYKYLLWFLNKNGKILPNIDNAIYGASYLYDKHSKKYGDRPKGITAIIFQNVIFSLLVIIYISIILDIANIMMAIICGNGDISVK